MAVIIMKVPLMTEKVIGMRFFYDCPPCGDDFESNEFFSKYFQKTGTIVGISEKETNDLFFRPTIKATVDIRFDGEEKIHKEMNARHLILLPTPQEEKLFQKRLESKTHSKPK